MGTSSLFWRSVGPLVVQPEDIVALSLRKQLEDSRVQLAEITESRSWKATLPFRRLRRALAPAHSLQAGLAERALGPSGVSGGSLDSDD
jgi:hypothetical protein